MRDKGERKRKLNWNKGETNCEKRKGERRQKQQSKMKSWKRVKKKSGKIRIEVEKENMYNLRAKNRY